MDSNAAVTALSALAQPSRLAVFRWLVECGPQGAFPGEIAERLGITPATLSFHLKALQHADLVERDRNGRFVRYQANFAVMNALLDFLTTNCCGGQPALCAPACAPAPEATPTAPRRAQPR